jgi:hypothetical protein
VEHPVGGKTKMANDPLKMSDADTGARYIARGVVNAWQPKDQPQIDTDSHR